MGASTDNQRYPVTMGKYQQYLQTMLSHYNRLKNANFAVSENSKSIASILPLTGELLGNSVRPPVQTLLEDFQTLVNAWEDEDFDPENQSVVSSDYLPSTFQDRYKLGHLSLPDVPCEATLWYYRHTARFHVNGVYLPGRGPQTDASCGRELGYYLCPNCGDTDLWKQQCTKSLCPLCYGVWLHRRTKDSGNRLEQIAAIFKTSPRHVVFSPPPGTNPSQSERNAIIKMAGITGGLVIHHPWRFKADVNDEQIPYGLSDLDPSSQVSIPSYAVFSPHDHVIGFGWLMDADEFHKKSGGWIYKNISARPVVYDDDGSLSKTGPIYWTIAYLLTHTGIEGRKQSVRWLGSCSNSKLAVETRTELEAKRCPVCNEDMLKYKLGSEGQSVEVDNERLVRYKFYRFKVIKK